MQVFSCPLELWHLNCLSRLSEPGAWLEAVLLRQAQGVNCLHRVFDLHVMFQVFPIIVALFSVVRFDCWSIANHLNTI